MNSDLYTLSRNELIALVIKHRAQTVALLQSKMDMRRDFTFVKVEPVRRGA